MELVYLSSKFGSQDEKLQQRARQLAHQLGRRFISRHREDCLTGHIQDRHIVFAPVHDHASALAVVGLSQEAFGIFLYSDNPRSMREYEKIDRVKVVGPIDCHRHLARVAQRLLER